MRHNKYHKSPLLLEMFPSHFPHVHLEFELFPTDHKSDYRLRLTIEPLKIMYDAVSLKLNILLLLFYIFSSQQLIDLLNVLKLMILLVKKHIKSLFICFYSKTINCYYYLE